MPGIEARAPERTDTSSGEFERRRTSAPTCLPIVRERRLDLVLQIVGQLAAVGVVVRADLGGDREARRHGQAEVRHLGEVGALAAQQILHLGVAVGRAAAEQIDALLRGARRMPWSGHAVRSTG